MARLLAIEWDASEARVAVGRARGTGVVVEQAFTVPLPKRTGAEAPPAEKEIGAAVAAALAQHGLARSEALVAVGRANIELRFLTTPPTPPEELPDLVRFQAMRQFTTLADDWPLDFVPLEENRDGGINVLAAAISPELVKQIRDTCTAAGITCSQLVLRPFATASLLIGDKADDRCRMLVDLLSDEADLTVMAGGKVIFPRTIRLPESDGGEAQGRALLGEIRRTVIAAQNQLGGRKVEQVVIFGDLRHHAPLKKLLEEELTLEAGVELEDPFTKVELEGEASRYRPEYPGTFAPLFGMLAEAAAGRPQQMDFLHPRQRPKPPNRRRTYAIAGGAAAAVALLILSLIGMQFATLDRQIRALQDDIAKQEKIVKGGKVARERAQKLDNFARGDIVWLDELRLLSQSAPPADVTQVELLSTAASKAGGGQLNITAVAKGAEDIEKWEHALRDKGRIVQRANIINDPKLTGLTLRFSEQVVLVPPDAPAAGGPRNARAADTKSPRSATKQASPPSTPRVPPTSGGKP